jgi:hypothetical protein
MAEKLVNFRTDEEKYNDLKMLALKERTTVKQLITDLIDDYLKKHGDGNPQFTLEQFEDPNFIACPAFYRDNMVWKNYISQATEDEREKLKAQIIMLDHTLGKFL